MARGSYSVREYQAKVIWKHGSRFVVRRVPRVVQAEGRVEYTYDYRHGTQIRAGYRYVAGRVYDRLPGYALHGPNGEYARLEWKQLRKWIDYFALQALLRVR